MNVIIWLINIVSSFSGFAALLILILIYFRFKNPGILSLFTGLILMSLNYISGIINFLNQNPLEIPEFTFDLASYSPGWMESIGEMIFYFIIILSFIYASTKLLKRPFLSRFISLFFPPMIFISIFYIVTVHLPESSYSLRLILFLLRMALYVVLMEYAILLPLFQKDRIWQPMQKAIMIFSGFFGFLCFPLMMMEDLFYLLKGGGVSNLFEAFSFLILTSGILVFSILFGLKYPATGKEKQRAEDFFRKQQLTGREREVCLYLMQNLSYKEIAEKLHISTETVKSHSKNIYKKGQFKNKQDLRDHLN